MKKFLALLLLSTAVHAQQPKAGQLYQSVQADLNGDGKPEKIGLVAYGHFPAGFFGRLKVWDSSGKLLWQAPAVKTPQDAYAFGNWEYGSSTIEWVGGNDLISAKPQSDVRPTTYKRFRWTGTAYVPNGVGYLLSNDNSDTYTWTKPFEWDGMKPLNWIVSLAKGQQDSNVMAAHGDQYLSGSAELQPTATGFQVTRWLKKLTAN
ncbi:MAG: hypothetical protein J0I12_18275 [Candidatus Eremiobacteraeota bacterium]|nr:hypothetical protein [Candidatus Eremiobacteraeota bacterium]